MNPFTVSPPVRQVRVGNARKQKTPAFVDRNAGVNGNCEALATLPGALDHVPQELWELTVISGI
ncbi:MAG: hypothetical protein ACJ8AF_09805 [Gemmatimonadaceae bacterium]